MNREQKRPNAAGKIGSRRMWILLFTVHCSLFTVFYDAFAADWSFTPSVTLSQSYDSNFRFLMTPTPGTTKDDFITTLTPVLSVTGETEQTKFQFDTVTSGQSYLLNPRFDIINTNTTSSLTESWSERFSTSVNVGLIHDSTLQQQLESSGIVTLLTERYLYTFGLGGKYDLTESLNLTASGLFAQSIYPSGALPDSNVYQGTITPIWTITPRDSIGLSSNFSDTEYDIGTTINTITETLYWQRQMTDTLSFKLSGGYYFAMLDFSIPALEFIPPSSIRRVNLPGSATDSGVVFGVDLKKDWSERFSTTFSAGNQQYNDVSANSYDSTFISGTAQYKLSEVTTFNFAARYNMNNEISQGGTNIDYYIINPSIERNITENLLLRLSGSYERESQSSSIFNVDRYRTWVDLTYKWPRFLASH